MEIQPLFVIVPKGENDPKVYNNGHFENRTAAKFSPKILTIYNK